MITKFQQHRFTTLVTHKRNEMNTVVYVQSTWRKCSCALVICFKQLGFSTISNHGELQC